MSDLLKVYKAEPTAQIFHETGHDASVVVRAVRGVPSSGKSVMCLMECFLVALDQHPINGVRRSRFGIFRSTYPSLLNTTMKTVANWFPERVWPIRKSIPPQQTIRFSLADKTKVEIEFIFMALETSSDVDKLKSLELTGAWLNEVFEMDRDLVTTALERVGRYPPVERDAMGYEIKESGPVRSSIWMDTNSPSETHWYASDEANPPEGWVFFVQPAPLIRHETRNERGEVVSTEWENNPLAENISNIKLGYDYYRRQVPGMKEHQIRVSIENRFGSVFDGKSVYENAWKREEMIAKELAKKKTFSGEIFVGMDTTGLNPGAVFGLVESGQIYIVHELIGEDVPFKTFIDRAFVPFVATYFPEASLICVTDPANPRDSRVGLTPVQDLRASGFTAYTAPTNSLAPRIAAVVDVMEKRGGFHVSPNCKILIEGFDGGYRFPKLKVTSGLTGKVFGDSPVKDIFSTAHDGLQYMMMWIYRKAGRNEEVGEKRADWRNNQQRRSVRRWA